MVFSARTLEKAISLYKKCTHSCILTDSHPVCVSSLCTQARRCVGESHSLLQAAIVTEKIYCRKLAISISAGGPEIIYQRFRDLRQHCTSFIQMLRANKIMIKHLTTCALCVLTSCLLIDWVQFTLQKEVGCYRF